MIFPPKFENDQNLTEKYCQAMPMPYQLLQPLAGGAAGAPYMIMNNGEVWHAFTGMETDSSCAIH